jgi:16S rRNA processing protein RimM
VAGDGTPDRPDGDAPLLEVGRITKPHGLRGELLVSLSSTESSRLAPGSMLLAGSRTLVVERSQPHQNRWIVAFEGVLTREQADELAGEVLRAAPKGDADDGDDDVLWVHELIGCEVVDLDGIDYGRVVSVIDNPAADVLELDSGGLVPLTFVVGGIEDAPHGGGRVVRIDPPDGLFDA